MYFIKIIALQTSQHPKKVLKNCCQC